MAGRPISTEPLVEKVICLLWAEEGADRSAFNAELLALLPVALAEAGASAIRLNLEDAQCAVGAMLRQSRGPRQHDAVVQFWLPSANHLQEARSTACSMAPALHGMAGLWRNRPSSPIPCIPLCPASGRSDGRKWRF